ncbi:flagellin [Nitriliruptor alkaliphilus]|uniref:flagellin N-terminal helical domain-containing protein n=1 Tax=Nitriliruptor alkaliphilus TaxID=427918 RepID=UPI000695C219|nr:flagellin [Nitriliruptor alkaliphilus]
MRINQNIAAFNAYRNLSTTSGQQAKSLEKLSSGFRINRAADDAAGLTKSEGLRAEIRGTNQAVKNAQDGISLVQTAEGALNEVHSILQRVRELAVGAANTATSDGVAEQAEITQLVEELGAIGDRTSFAGKKILGDDAGVYTFQVGAKSGDTLVVDLNAVDTTNFDGVDLTAIDVSNVGADFVAILDDLDTAIAHVSTERSTLGAKQNRLEHTIANLQVASENLSASESRIRDTDMAQEMVAFTRAQILQQAGTAMLAQANQVPQSVLSLLR